MSWQAGETSTNVVGRAVRSRLVSRFVRDKTAMLGAVLLGIIVVVAVFAPEIAPHSPTANVSLINVGPSMKHWLGTDDIGRDIASRLIFGSRISLEVAVSVVVLALVVALPIGLVAGYFGGLLDNLLMRVMDAMFSFPPLLLAIAVAALLGKSLHNEIVAIAVPFIPGFARVIRGQVLSRAGGDLHRSVAVDRRRFGAHALPAHPAQRGVAAHRPGCGLARVCVAGRCRAQLPRPRTAAASASWAAMIQEAYQYVLSDPWATIVPGVAIAITVLAFNFVGDGLRDALGRERVAGKA